MEWFHVFKDDYIDELERSEEEDETSLEMESGIQFAPQEQATDFVMSSKATDMMRYLFFYHERTVAEELAKRGLVLDGAYKKDLWRRMIKPVALRLLRERNMLA
jgi:hypothetical protein